MLAAERAAQMRTARLRPARRQFIAVELLGMIGHGIWVPLIFLYFTLGRGLPLAGAGAAVTIGGCVALVFGTTVTWRVVDGIGPFRTKALAGVLNVPAFAGYLITRNLDEVAVFSALSAMAGSLFFTSEPEAVRRISVDDHQRVHTFALLTSLHVIGFGLGTVVATLGLVLDVDTGRVWDILVALIAGINLLSAVLFWFLRYVDDIWLSDRMDSHAGHHLPRYREVLTERRFMVFIGGLFVVALVTIGMDVALPVYLLSLGLPPWSSTASYLVICLLMAFSAQVITRLARVVGELRLLIGSTVSLAAAYLVFIGLTVVDGMVLLLMLVAGLMLFSAANATSNALAGNVMLSFAPEKSSGRHASLFQTAWALASTIAPGIYAALFSVGRTLPWILSTVLLGAAATAYTAVDRSKSYVYRELTTLDRKAKADSR